MGRAIVRDPKVFLFDEPLSNLDAKLRTQMRVEIKRLQRELGTTSIYVTHDQVEAMTLADRLPEKVIKIGIRPEQLFISGEGQPADITLDTSVLAVEDLGADCLIYIEVKADKSQLIWRAPAGTEVEIGENLSLSANRESLHLFDNDSGARIDI